MYIQNVQEQEQSVEEEKKKFLASQAEMEKKVKELMDSKERMTKQIVERSQKVSTLENKLANEGNVEFIAPDTFRLLEDRIRVIYQDFMGTEEMHAQPIRMLKAIEGKFIGYLAHFEDIEVASEGNKNWIIEAVNEREKSRKKCRHERLQEEMENEIRERAEKYKKRAADTAKGQTFGKPLMKKCRVPEKAKKKVEKVVDPEEEFMREFLHS